MPRRLPGSFEKDHSIDYRRDYDGPAMFAYVKNENITPEWAYNLLDKFLEPDPKGLDQGRLYPEERRRKLVEWLLRGREGSAGGNVSGDFLREGFTSVNLALAWFKAADTSNPNLAIDGKRAGILGTEPWFGPAADCSILNIKQGWYGREGWPSNPQFAASMDEKWSAILLEKFMQTIDAIQPWFGLMDNFGKNIIDHEGEDLRRFTWGVTIYGPDLVQKIGREKLLKTPTYKVEELPWGGVWVQVAENPFTAPVEEKRKVEKYLDLKNVFGADGH